MPTYVYEDLDTGKTVELVKPIAQRNDVPPNLKRISAPQRLTVFGTSSDKIEPNTVFSSVPKAFRDYELSGKSCKQIEKEVQFSRDHIRRVFNFLFLCVAMLTLSTNAADVAPGYSFLVNDHVTAAKLNAATAGSINQSFIHGQTFAAPNGADEFIYWLSPGGPFRRTSHAVMFTSNTNLITFQTPTTTPDQTNTMLIMDTTYNGFKQTSLANVLSNTLFQVTTQLVTQTSFRSSDALLEADNTAGRLRQMTVSNLFQTVTNLPTTNVPNATSTLVLVDPASGVPAQVSVSNLLASQTAYFVSTNVPMTNSFNAGTNTVGTIMNQAHGLGLVPRMVRAVAVYTNATSIGGYAANDEVELHEFFTLVDAAPYLTYGANSTSVFVAKRNTSTPELFSRVNGAPQVIDATNWVIKVYARP